MKTNYETGDKVTISKPGLFDGLSGEILANNPDIKNSLSVMLNLSTSNILWNFSYADILQTQNNSTTGLKSTHTFKEVKAVVEVKQKRSYQKRDKTEVKATKRKYNKKVKS